MSIRNIALITLALVASAAVGGITTAAATHTPAAPAARTITVTKTVPGPTVTKTVPGPTRTVTKTVPGPVHTVVKTVPGPVRTVPGPTRTVKVPGPVKTVYSPSPEQMDTIFRRGVDLGKIQVFQGLEVALRTPCATATSHTCHAPDYVDVNGARFNITGGQQ